MGNRRFRSAPIGIGAPECSAWAKYSGDSEFCDEFSVGFGLKAFSCGANGAQARDWFNEEINSLDDHKSRKLRIPGLGGAVLANLASLGMRFSIG